MFSEDFYYDGQCLSDYNCIICNFEASTGSQIVSAGSHITFNKVALNNGKNYALVGHQYDTCIETSFYICKNPEIFSVDDRTITSEELRDLMRWLNRGQFCKFNFFYNDGSEVVYYNASFNVEKVKVNEQLVGLKLNMYTDKPFGYGAVQEYKFDVKRTHLNKEYSVSIFSDELGDLIPDLKITCSAAGDLELKNITNGSRLKIENCTMGEIITFDSQTLCFTSSTGRNILDSFNYEFLKLTNTMAARTNRITVSLPSVLNIKYTPIVKFGI